MTTVFEKLIQVRDQIECNACGKCCQGFKRPCQRLTSEGLCSIHPAITGVDMREELEPECNADVDPIEALHIGYLCEPVVEAIKQWTGIELEADRRMRSPLGEHIYVNRSQLNQVYAMRVD